ncbi:hypothetical protein N574_0116465 [Lactiplantibacillus plantarum 2165]|nr:hypothetical protein N574_0116465 [Lactiplantibacillus plantarum 2165]
MMDQNSNLHVKARRPSVHVQNLSPVYLRGKRIFDILASAAGLIILAIPFLIIGLIIKLDDPKGGVFYSQIRLGKDGKEFRMWKFRSMVANADQMVDKLMEQNEI